MQKQIMVLGIKELDRSNDSIYDTFVAKTLYLALLSKIQFIVSQNSFNEKSVF